jgi:hypothetical protein
MEHRYDDQIVIEPEVYSGSNFSGFSAAPPIATLVASDAKRNDKMVIEKRWLTKSE